MPPSAEPAAGFEPPGPGMWTLDTGHFPQPATRFVSELFPEPARRGFREATARYGLLMDHIEWAFVHGWAYLCPRPVRALGEGMTRERWEALVGATVGVGERLASSATVFQDRRWREDVAEWDHWTKPRMDRAHRELQAVEPTHLSASQLLSHLQRCRQNLQRAVHEHHRLDVAPVIPAGDFLVHAEEWTGRSTADLVQLIRGGDPLALAAGPELTRLAQAARQEPPGAAILTSEDEPGAVLHALASRPGAVGRAVAGYLNVVGWWSAGSGCDVGEPCLLELPHLLLGTIRTAVQAGPRAAEPPASAELLAEVRAAVPAASRDAFDALLAEARATHRVRDERAIHCDVWAYGLTRRAILAAGRGLTEDGAIQEPEHLVEASYAELRSMIERTSGPSGEELAARAGYRRAATHHHIPALLGGPPPAPVPIEWLSPGAARTERAFRTYLRAMSGEEPSVGGAVSGVPASPGRYEGRARVIHSTADLARIEPGDVLVTGSTTPALNPVLPLLGAIVTDRGGLLSHAAIVAREFGIPAVVGTGDATTRIPDGALVRVDGATGQTTLLGPHSESNRSR
ncbi:MAG: PEP-utilizing enzyme [Actinomycetota bacterium]|nr:PEP-utilizing enzyme [Actinomycetota bacterium]